MTCRLGGSLHRLGNGLVIKDARKFLPKTESSNPEQKSSTSTAHIAPSLEAIQSVVRDLRRNLAVASDGTSLLRRGGSPHDTSASQPLRISFYFNRVATPWHVRRDLFIQRSLGASGVQVRTFKGVMLYEPWEVRPSHVPGALTHGFGSVGFFIRSAWPQYHGLANGLSTVCIQYTQIYA